MSDGQPLCGDRPGCGFLKVVALAPGRRRGRNRARILIFRLFECDTAVSLPECTWVWDVPCRAVIPIPFYLLEAAALLELGCSVGLPLGLCLLHLMNQRIRCQNKKSEVKKTIETSRVFLVISFDVSYLSHEEATARKTVVTTNGPRVCSFISSLSSCCLLLLGRVIAP